MTQFRDLIDKDRLLNRQSVQNDGPWMCDRPQEQLWLYKLPRIELPFSLVEHHLRKLETRKEMWGKKMVMKQCDIKVICNRVIGRP